MGCRTVVFDFICTTSEKFRDDYLPHLNVCGNANFFKYLLTKTFHLHTAPDWIGMCLGDWRFDANVCNKIEEN